MVEARYPIITQDTITPDIFPNLLHALFSIKHDEVGEIAQVLAQKYHLQCRIVLTSWISTFSVNSIIFSN
ncbi:transcriptional regulator [Calothrix brevissima NIES-22]|nr:transcriptional regulator [Calothrix brevissima NIES-22]